MAVIQSLRDKLPCGSVVFDNQAYDKSIIGVSLDGRVIYSYERMVEELMVEDGCTDDDAIDWIEYNTLRAIPYLPEPRPMVVHEMEG